MPLDYSRYIHDPDRSPYHVLRIARTATEDEILAAWEARRALYDSHTHPQLSPVSARFLAWAYDNARERCVQMRREDVRAEQERCNMLETAREDAEREVNAMMELLSPFLEFREETERYALLEKNYGETAPLNGVVSAVEPAQTGGALLVGFHRLVRSLQAELADAHRSIALEQSATRTVEMRLMELDRAVEAMHGAWDARLVRIYEDLLFVRFRSEVAQSISEARPEQEDQNERIRALETQLAEAREAVVRLQQRACAAGGELEALKQARFALELECEDLRRQKGVDELMKRRMAEEISRLGAPQQDAQPIKRKHVSAFESKDQSDLFKQRIAQFFARRVVVEEDGFAPIDALARAFLQEGGELLSQQVFSVELRRCAGGAQIIKRGGCRGFVGLRMVGGE